MKFINEFIRKLERRNITMKKCTKEEIDKVCSLANGKKLPEAYIEFMTVIGNGTDGDYLIGDSCFMDEIEDLNEGAAEILEEDESKHTLTEEDFVFWMCQGCQICFFKLNEGDNPPVYFYNEDGKDEIVKIADTLTEFLINMIEIEEDTFEAK